MDKTGRAKQQIVKVFTSGAMGLIMGLSASAGEITYNGNTYKNAKVVTSSEYLSIVHDGGIKRIPWDKVPSSLKTLYPQPAASATGTEEEVKDEDKKSTRRPRGAFGRTAPSMEDLTKRYRGDLDYAKDRLDKAPKDKKAKTDYLEAKTRHDKAISHYKKMLAKNGNDPLAAADEWQKTIREALEGKKVEIKAYDFSGTATIAYFPPKYSRGNMEGTLAKQGEWLNWPIWRLSNGGGLAKGQIVWIDNLSSIEAADQKVSKNSMTINVALKLSGTAMVSNTGGKDFTLQKFVVVRKK